MTAIVKTWFDPNGISKKTNNELVVGSDFRDYLIGEYGKNGFQVPTVVYKNNKLIDLSNYEFDKLTVNKNDQFVIVSNPLGFDPLTLGIIAGGVSFLIGLAVYNSLISTPEIPELEKFNEGPNNQIIGQTNVVRALQRVPDIFGKNRIYPDLIAVSYHEYIDQRKIVTEYFCIGRGQYLVEDIKNAETLIDDISESTATVYEPNTAPATLLDVIETKAANGQNINPPFEITKNIKILYTSLYDEFSATDLSEFANMTDGDYFTFEFPSVARITTDALSTDIVGGFQPFTGNKITKATGNFLSFTVGDVVLISGATNPSNNTYKRIKSITNDTEMFVESPNIFPQSMISETGSTITITNPVVQPSTYQTLERNSLRFMSYTPGSPDVVKIYPNTPLAPSDPVEVSATMVGFEDTVGPFNLVPNCDEVWIDFLFNAGNDIDVDFDVVLTSGGIFEFIQSVNIPANPDAPGFYTEKIPLDDSKSYECEVVRTSQETNTNIAKIGRMASVIYYNSIDFGDVTTMLVTTSSGGSGGGNTREINASVTRKLRTYDLDTQTIIETLNPTEKFADAAFHVLTDPLSGNKTPSQIDLDELYTIQESLEGDPIYGDDLGKFAYSFADSSVKVSSELKTIMNAVRGFSYREGDIIRFARDEVKQRSALFNNRNKKPNSETKVVKFQRFDDPDGIEFSWQSGDTAEGFTLIFPEGSTPLNPSRITGAGIKNYNQAWNRAKYEYLKLLYQRRTVSTVVTADGILSTLSDRVANVDGTNIKSQNGEIISFTGLTLETSEIIDFMGNLTATVVLSNDDGSIQDNVTVTPRGDGINGFILDEARSIVLRGDNDYQVGTRYAFYAENDDDQDDYSIQEISPSDNGYVSIKMINYDQRIYAPDTEVPTPQS